MATKGDPRIPPSQASGVKRLPIQSVGPKSTPTPPPSDGEAPTAEQEFDPFRFAVTELPPGMRQQLIATKLPVVPRDQLFDTKPPNAPLPASPRNSTSAPNSVAIVESPDSFRLPLRTNRVLLLCALVLVALAFAIVFKLKAPGAGETAAPAVTQAARLAAPPAQLPPLGNGMPVDAVRGSPSAAPPRAKSQPATQPANRAAAAKEIAAPSRTPAASVHREPAPSARPAISEPPAPAPPKKESALGSVLAPPPD